jgi:hypothetical protein
VEVAGYVVATDTLMILVTTNKGGGGGSSYIWSSDYFDYAPVDYEVL